MTNNVISKVKSTFICETLILIIYVAPHLHVDYSYRLNIITRLIEDIPKIFMIATNPHAAVILKICHGTMLPIPLALSCRTCILTITNIIVTIKLYVNIDMQIWRI